MTSEYSLFDIIIAPFPFVEKPESKPRPVLVLSASNFNARNGHIIGAMITTTAHSHWKDDMEIVNLDTAGLPKPCRVRWKLFTLPVDLIKKKIGEIAIEERAAVRAKLSSIFME